MPIPDSLKKLQMKFNYRADAEIAGVKFGLQVLSLSDEQKVQSIPTDDLDGITFFSEMQKGMLAYAIRSIDGEEIPDVIEEEAAEDGKKSSRERPLYVREFLDSLPHKVTERLFEVYIDLREKKEDEIANSLSYSWYKTPEVREKERKEKEAQVQRETEAEEKSAESKGTELSGETGPSNVPSPDGDIELKRIPTDFSDVSAPEKE